MHAVVSILIVFASVLLVLVVLIQNSKGGGLASNFQSSNQVMGVRKTADFLEKATWTLAIAIGVLSFISVMVLPRQEMGRQSVIDSQLQNMVPPTQGVPSYSVGDDEIAPAQEAPVQDEE